MKRRIAVILIAAMTLSTPYQNILNGRIQDAPLQFLSFKNKL